MTTAAMESPHTLAPEDQARAEFYGLLARLLRAAPDAALLQRLAAAPDLSGHGPLATAWSRLVTASSVMDADAAEEEYAQVFIGLGQGEVMPYASWHLTGFMMEEPLARLREDLTAFRLVRADGVGEPEDHIAALCEVMQLLVAGDDRAQPQSLARQHAFFRKHLRPWYAAFCAQLEAAPSANYYRAVAALLRAFLEVESQAFDMD